jgi:hypothetical protein
VKFSLSGRDSSVKSALTELEKKFEELGLNSNKISKFSVLLGKMFLKHLCAINGIALGQAI